MGKKVKKVVKKVTKVATKPIKKVAIDPIKKGASSVTDALGLGPGAAYDDSGMIAQQEALSAQQRQAFLDSQVDMGLGDRATILEGEAAAVAAEGDPSKRRRKGSGSLSEALGLGGL